jgi:AmmeMemoRadiSam system protein A
MLSETDKRALLGIARQTIEARLKGEPRPPTPTGSDALEVPCGAFVTLKNGGRLRGCIGTFTSKKPLRETVQEMAEAALRDPRFLSDPVTARELSELDIEISALSPLAKTTDPMGEIELGRDGIYIEGGVRGGCFLPQVATETGWSKEEFLANCCTHKAGLPPDAWKSPDVTVYRFQAEVFGEE